MVLLATHHCRDYGVNLWPTLLQLIEFGRALWLNSSSLIVENMLIVKGDVVALTKDREWRTEDIGRMGHVIRRSRKHAQIAKSHVCVYLFHVQIHFAHAQTPTWLMTMYTTWGRFHVTYASQDKSWLTYLYNFSLVWIWCSFKHPCTPTNNNQAMNKKNALATLSEIW